ncbi:MAG: polyphosphate kinase 2 [Deltaproteobacteria bacterium]|nr:polyphosphate kinase 2 [Deltaproteobacteria bacterium]
MAKGKAGKEKKRNKDVKAKNPGRIAEVIEIEEKKAAKEEEKNKKEGKKKGKKKGKKQKKALKEHTAISFIDKKKGKNRQAVWVSKFTLKYEEELQKLQIELLKWQKHVIAKEQKVLLIFEGRDAAGKGGTIKRIVEHLNPRGARVVALLKPSDRERTQWYFQRYFQQLPTGGEIVLFDRSWYNRAMVEPTMGFCTDEEHKRFLKDVPLIEEILVKNGIHLFKFFFSVSKEEQIRRFKSRIKDPLKQYKISPVDMEAQEKWDDYTVRKFQMLNETNRTISPWTIIRSDNKKKARINCIKYILSKVEYENKIPQEEFEFDPEVVVSGIEEIKYMEDHLMTGMELPG